MSEIRVRRKPLVLDELFLRTFGVYKIENILSKKVYIGSTVNSFSQRWNSHASQLRRGIHFNKHLQNSWNKHGEVNFEFSVEEKPKERRSSSEIW